MTFHPPSRHARAPVLLAACCVGLASVLPSPSAWAQMPSLAPTHPPALPAAAPAPTEAAPLNGYAPTLKPTAAKRRRVTPDVAYDPVKNLDDQGQTPEIDMFVGESRVLPAPGVGRIAVGNGQILTAAALDQKEILLFANGPGTSSLFIWHDDGRYQRLKINIVRGDTSRIGREIAAFLTSIPGAKASIVGDKVIVEGEHLSDVDRDKLKRLEVTYPQIVNFTSTQGWEKMIMMDVKVVEFPRSEMQELGLKWAATGGGTVAGIWAPIRKGHNGPYQVNIPSTSGQSGLPITDPSQTSASLHSALNVLGGFNLGLNAQLLALAQEGRAAVLAEPQLSTRSGSTATFQAGGEFPYVVSTINGPTVQFKPYGIRLEIKPTVDRSGYVRATIDTEVSAIDASVSTPEGPALKTRNTKTEFNTKAGETIVLSGMLSRDSNHSIDKVPFLGDIPILGALFKSRRFQNSETELVVFVTPMVVDAQTPSLVNRLDKTRERLAQQMGPAPYLTEPLQPEPSPGPGPSPASVPTPTPTLTPKPKPTSTPTPGAGSTPPSVGPLSTAQDPDPVSTAPPVAGLRVKLEGLALRAAPDLHSPMLMTLGAGAVVQAGASQAPGPLARVWRSVVVGDAQGWVAAKWVEPTSGAPSAHPRMGTLARQAQQGVHLGASVTPLPVAPLSDLPDRLATPAAPPLPSPSPSPQASPPAKAPQAEGPRFRVMLPKLALRVAPDVNAAIVQQVPEGAVLNGRAMAAVGGWLPVTLGESHGWVPAQWVQAQP